MRNEEIAKDARADVEWHEDDIPIRGCQLTLQQVKAAYRELSAVSFKEGERVVASLKKPDDVSDDEFRKRNDFLKKDAFKITISIIGFNGRTSYGESEDVFESKNLPTPIKTILFTNVNSFKRHSNGTEPANRFSIWIHFDKPPLFDPNPLVSEPTRNYSQALIQADDLGYFRAVQSIVSTHLRSRKKWYSFIHEKFAYDAGLWFVAFPYALYMVTIYSDHLFPPSSKLHSFRIAFFIYGLGIMLLAYRALFSYVKWAFPVNILEENKDRALSHRVTLGALLFSLIAGAVRSVANTIAGF